MHSVYEEPASAQHEPAPPLLEDEHRLQEAAPASSGSSGELDAVQVAQLAIAASHDPGGGGQDTGSEDGFGSSDGGSPLHALPFFLEGTPPEISLDGSPCLRRFNGAEDPVGAHLQ